MVGIALRTFDCTLCQAQFERLAGDLMVPAPNLCDACLQVVWEMDDATLAAHISRSLTDNASKLERGYAPYGGQRALEEGTVRYVQWHREQWNSAEEAISVREQERKDWGQSC